MNFSLNSNTVKFTKILVLGNQPSRPFMSQSLSVKPHGSTTTIRCQLWGMRPSMPRWRTTRPTRRVQLWKRPMELLAARRQCIEPCVNQSKSQLHFLLISKHGHTKSQILTLLIIQKFCCTYYFINPIYIQHVHYRIHYQYRMPWCSLKKKHYQHVHYRIHAHMTHMKYIIFSTSRSVSVQIIFHLLLCTWIQVLSFSFGPAGHTRRAKQR